MKGIAAFSAWRGILRTLPVAYEPLTLLPESKVSLTGKGLHPKIRCSLLGPFGCLGPTSEIKTSKLNQTEPKGNAPVRSI